MHAWGSVDVHVCIQDAFLYEGQNSTLGIVPWEVFLETEGLTGVQGLSVTID